jgi:signal transduction histidine kinase
VSAGSLLPPIDLDTHRLARRLRIAVTWCIAPIVLFGLFDLVLVPRQQRWLFALLKLAALAVVAMVLLALRHARTRRQVITVGLLCIAGMYAVSTVSGVLAHDAETTMILTLAVALASATLLPWGVAPQVGVVGIACVALATITYLVTGTLDELLRYPVLGVAISVFGSIYLASEFEASRRALEAHDAERRRGAQAVRQLNEQLEARVAQRTAELQDVNRALQAEVLERRRADQALRESRAAVAAVVENAADAIWAIDRNYRLTACNAVVRERFASAYGGHLRSAFENYPAAARAYWERDWLPRYRRGLAGERFVVEHSFELGGEPRHYVTSFNPIVDDGVVTGLAIFSSDVTERRRAEDAARQRQAELTHVLRLSTMGEMAAGLAHEINQPLAAIVNYAQGCRRRLRDDAGSVPAVLPVIDSIASEALRAGEIVRRLRHLVRKDGGRQEWVDVNALVADAGRLIEPEARQHSVEMDLYLAPALPRLLGDGVQIEQVVLNLLRNAIEAMRDMAGRRTLQVATRSASAGAIELAVRDSGPGIAPDVAPHVFDPFFTTKPNGLGMGLSISRSIVESHHGRVWATPNPDGGTTVRVRLPADAASAPVALAAS